MPFVSHRDHQNSSWSLWQNPDGTFSSETVTRAILLDIRTELSRMNNVLQCHNTVRIPGILDQIAKNTKKRKYTKKGGKK